MKNQLALKSAVFPDGKSLQPIPTPNGEHANISGNINSTTSIQTSPNKELVPSEAINEVNNTPNVVEQSQTNYSYYIVCTLVIVVIISILFYTSKNRIKR